MSEQLDRTWKGQLKKHTKNFRHEEVKKVTYTHIISGLQMERNLV